MPKSSTNDEPPDTVASSDSVSSRIMLLLSMPETVVRWSLSRCDQRHNFLIVNYANSILVLPLDSICPFQEISGKGLEAESSLRIIDCLCQLKARRACARSCSASVSLSVTARASADNKVILKIDHSANQARAGRLQK
jgi:hypothetical protein